MNTLQKPCNYYEKYMKYKKKYIDYKNNLLALSGKKSALIGGGIDAQIQFLYSQFSQFSQFNADITKYDIKYYIDNFVNSIIIVVKYRDALDGQEKVVKYRIIEKAGNGATGAVYKLEQTEPLLPPPPPGSNNSFAIKLTILNVGDSVDDAENKREKKQKIKKKEKKLMVYKLKGE